MCWDTQVSDGAHSDVTRMVTWFLAFFVNV